MLTAQEKRFQLQSMPAETVTRVAINEACVIRAERWFPHVRMLEDWAVHIYTH